MDAKIKTTKNIDELSLARSKAETMNLEKWVEFRVENNVNYLTFWATVFLTCFIGIIELLPELKKISWYFGGLSILYFILVIGMCLSIDGCIRIYGENVHFWREGYFGNWHNIIPIIKHTRMDKFLLNERNMIRENVILLPITFGILFVVIYIFKIVSFSIN
ncbi:MAG: hypothetical protein NWF07_04000 [Candidatus Bathyarchaeota archaeon]|nr:hypothetical protein [Candidatus Bathyarchaeota archaeon]